MELELLIAPKEVFTKFGNKVIINPESYDTLDEIISIDCETDEQDNFVGLAIFDGVTCYYFSYINDKLRDLISNKKLIGHNIKGDAKWLTSWRFKINSNNLYCDTALMSYVINSTKESHKLKDLANEFLNLQWETYKQMTHPYLDHPNKKVTLDQQLVGQVAAYCGADAIATYRLYKFFEKNMGENDIKILEDLELPLMRILFEMEIKGVRLDKQKVSDLILDYETILNEKANFLKQWTRGIVNLNSPKQLKIYIENDIIKGPILNTSKSVLEAYDNHPFIKELLKYKRYFKLYSTYLIPFNNEEKLYPTYNQIIRTAKDEWRGISTGRLSCSNPNLQNIPVSGFDGEKFRSLFVASPNKRLIVADYSQIEYRLLAHFSQERGLLEAFYNGYDIHKKTGDLLGVNRDIGKTLNFAAIYGAKSPKIAKTAKITEEEAEKFLKKYWRILPSVTSWINKVKWQAAQTKQIQTLYGRIIPIPLISSKDKYERLHWERASVNYIIQGSAADILKLAMIKCNEYGYLPILTVHDELIFEADTADKISIDIRKKEIKKVMENVIKISVPLEVTINDGNNWAEAKRK